MFIRNKADKNKPGTRVQIVKSVRHVGTASSAAQLANLQALARIIIAEIEQAEEPQTSLFTPHETAAMQQQTRDRAALKPCGRCQFEPSSGVSINGLSRCSMYCQH